MRIQLHNNALRFTRYSATAWTLFVTTFLIWSVDPAFFGISAQVHSMLTYAMSGAFAVGCLFMAGTAGVRAFSRVAPF